MAEAYLAEADGSPDEWGRGALKNYAQHATDLAAILEAEAATHDCEALRVEG